MSDHGERSQRSRLAWAAMAIVVLVVLGLVAVGFVRVVSDDPEPATRPSPSATIGESPGEMIVVEPPHEARGSNARIIDLWTGERSRLPRAIARVPRDCCYSVSPDGTRIAFVGMVGASDDAWSERYGILVADVDGGRARQIAADVGTDGYMSGGRQDGPIAAPQWSPDGRKIVYQRERDFAIVVVDVDTGHATRVVQGGRRARTQPAFGPNGRTILFTRWHREHPVALWTVPVRGGPGSVLLEPGSFGTFSPDGTTIAYTWVDTDPVPNSYKGIWLADADGAHRSHVPSLFNGTMMGVFTGLQERSRAAWSPDGTRIAASLVEGGPVVVVDLTTGAHETVGGGGVPVWLDDHTLIVDGYEPVR